MKLCVFLMLAINICYSRPPVDDTPLLQFIDVKIGEQIYDPTEGQGDALAKNLRTYNKRLAEVIDMIDQDVYDAFVKSKSLLKIGGPQFLLSHFDKGLSKHIYNWTETQVQDLSKGLRETKKLWSKIVDMLPKNEKKFEKIITAEKANQRNVFDREKKRIEEFHKDWDAFQARRKVEREEEKRLGIDISNVSENSTDSSEFYDSSKTHYASSYIPPEFEAKSTLSSLEDE